MLKKAREKPEVEGALHLCTTRTNKTGLRLEHAEEGAGEGAELVGGVGGVEVEGEDREERHDQPQDEEGVGH